MGSRHIGLSSPGAGVRIDAHQHFWNFDPARHAWITEEMSLLKRDFLPVDLLPELEANGIDASVAVQAEQSEEETRFLLRLAENNSRIAGVVGWVDLRSPDVEKRLGNFSDHKKLRGFRHIAQSEPDDRFLASAAFVRGMSKLAAFGFSYDILIYPRQLAAARELAERLPEQRFVIDHLAKPDIKNGANQKEWAHHMRAIAQNGNVFCKISGLVTEADWVSWKTDDFREYLDVVFDAFGTDRLLFGSDWPVCLLAASYRRVKQIVEEYVAGQADTGKEKIFGENAVRFYNFPVSAHGSAD